MPKSQKMRRLLINHRSPKGSSGKPSGISNYMLFLTRALLNSDQIEVGLVTSWNWEDLPEDIRERVVFYKQKYPIRPRLFDVLWQGLYMPFLTNRFSADVVLNVDSIGTPAGGKKRFTVIHDLYQKVRPQDYPCREKLFNDLIMKIMIAGSNKLICISDCTKGDLEKYYPKSVGRNARIYSNASEVLDVGSPVVKGTKQYVIWVGTITPNKNIQVFYRALDLLAEHGNELNAVVVGRDPHGLATLAQDQLQYHQGPTRKENITDDELGKLIRNAACFVNTSYYEGFGMPVIEAQRAGVATICSSGGACAEIGGGGASTFEATDAEGLASTMQKVMADFEFRRLLIESGYANAKRFSWKKVAEEVIHLINN